MPNIDPRAKRSKLMLIDALIELMKTKDANKISVKELTEKAELSRSTFYLHFEDMPHFLHDLSKKTLNMLIAYTNKGDLDTSSLSQTRTFYIRYFKYIEKKKTLFLALLGEHGYPEFRQMLIQRGYDEYYVILEPFQKEIEKEISMDILIHYIISAHTGLMEHWLITGCKYSAEYMAKQIEYLTIDCLKPIVLLKDIINLPH